MEVVVLATHVLLVFVEAFADLGGIVPFSIDILGEQAFGRLIGHFWGQVHVQFLDISPGALLGYLGRHKPFIIVVLEVVWIAVDDTLV